MDTGFFYVIFCDMLMMYIHLLEDLLKKAIVKANPDLNDRMSAKDCQKKGLQSEKKGYPSEVSLIQKHLTRLLKKKNFVHNPQISGY